MPEPAARLPGPPLLLLVALATTGTLAMHMFVPALPFAAVELGVGRAEVQLSVGIYVLGLAVGQLIYGPVSDALGRRPVVIAGLLVFFAGSLACAIAPTLPTLLAGRLLQGLGGAGGITLARAIVRDVAGAGGSQRDISLLNLIMLLGPSVSPVAGSMISVYAGWRGIFFLLALIAVLVFIAVLPLLRETAQHRKPLNTGQLRRDFLTLAGNRRFVCVALGGALGSTMTYGYFAAAPYILDQLGVLPVNVGYFLGGTSVGALTGTYTSRLRVGRMSQNLFLLLSSLLAVAAAGLFLVAALAGAMNPVLLFAISFALMFAAGCISPTALAASLDTVPELAGSAAGFFGAAQMAVGGLCTVLVGFGSRQDVSCGLVMAGAALISLALLLIGRQRD